MQAKILVAVWEYRDATGKKRRAYFGDDVELTDAEAARAEMEGVLGTAEPEPETGPIEEGDSGDGDGGEAGEGQDDGEPAPPPPPKRPAKAALTELWAEYVVALGKATPEEAAGMQRKDLIALADS